MNDTLSNPDIGVKVPMPTLEQRKAINWLVNENKAKDRARREALRAVRKVELARRALECLQPEVPSLRGEDMQKHATNEHHQRSAGRTNRGEYFGLGEVWSAGIRAKAISEGITAV